MIATIAPSSTAASTLTVSKEYLREAVAKYVYLGGSALAPEVLMVLQREIARLKEWAESLALTERDVVVGLLRPVLSCGGHCQCSSCRERCLVCSYRALSASLQQ